MDKYGQSNLGILFGVFVALLTFIYFFSSQISYWLDLGVSRFAMTGIAALIFSNMTLFIFFSMILLLLAAARFGGGA